jgi:hypothetical protein
MYLAQAWMPGKSQAQDSFSRSPLQITAEKIQGRGGMGMRKMAALYAFIMGLVIICALAVSYLAGAELISNSAPYETTFHEIAEIMTASALLFSGWALWRNRAQSFQAYAISMGMLFSTIIMNPDYFPHESAWVFIAVSTMFVVLTAAFIRSAFVRLEHMPAGDYPAQP